MAIDRLQGLESGGGIPGNGHKGREALSVTRTDLSHNCRVYDDIKDPPT
jgi:hypothetical protein